MRHRMLFCFAGLVAAAVAGTASAGEKWLHVRIVEAGEKPETVRVNLPLSLLKNVTAALPEEVARGGKLAIPGMKLDEKQRKAIVESLAAIPDGEFVTVDSPEETVKMSKSGSDLLVQVRERSDEGEVVDIRVPLRLASALFSSEPGTLDLAAFLRDLEEQPAGDLITVKDRESDVRIWLDERSSDE